MTHTEEGGCPQPWPHSLKKKRNTSLLPQPETGLGAISCVTSDSGPGGLLQALRPAQPAGLASPSHPS